MKWSSAAGAPPPRGAQAEVVPANLVTRVSSDALLGAGTNPGSRRTRSAPPSDRPRGPQPEGFHPSLAARRRRMIPCIMTRTPRRATHTGRASPASESARSRSEGRGCRTTRCPHDDPQAWAEERPPRVRRRQLCLRRRRRRRRRDEPSVAAAPITATPAAERPGSRGSRGSRAGSSRLSISPCPDLFALYSTCSPLRVPSRSSPASSSFTAPTAASPRRR